MINVSQQDFLNFLKESSFIIGSAYSEAYGKLLDKWSSGVFSEQQKIRDILDARKEAVQVITQKFMDYSRLDGVWKDNPGQRQLAEQYHQKWEAKLSAITADLRPASQQIADLNKEWGAAAQNMETLAAKNPNLLKHLGSILDVWQLGEGALEYKLTGDPTKAQKAIMSIVAAECAVAATIFSLGILSPFIAIPAFAYVGTVFVAAAFANWAGGEYGVEMFDWIFKQLDTWKISPHVGLYADTAFADSDLRDPLALDLNGNGISTLSANEGITFDHNGSGTKYGTGWINPLDGWLALDRNGNGAIDSGRELFGDSTRKLDGNFALGAYDALASFDTNKDGKVDVADATGDTNNNGVIDGTETFWDINNNGVYNASVDKKFADLRVWVDANSDGISSSGELKTLAELGITSIATGKTAGSGVDANGNNNTFKGNFTTTGNVVHTNGTRSFNLVENKFNREFPGNITVPADVAALPNMQGSGAVRDLHQAMSLGTAESAALKTTVQAFSSAVIGAFWNSLAANDCFYSGRPWGLQNA